MSADPDDLGKSVGSPDRREVRFGPYLILERIGEGGMCHVFRARRSDLGIDCALKILKAEVRHDPRVHDLFITEADLSLLLKHPNLIRSYDAGEMEGRAYIAMELLGGGSLGELAVRLTKEGLPFPDDLVLFVVSEMLAGLESLHEAKGESGRRLGIIHRDVTPHNVFLGSEGRVVLGDYGVAHIEAHGTDLQDDVPGKVTYLAPEALTGGVVDRRADIFSAGVIVYELLLGHRPFEGESDESTMDSIVDARLERPRRLRPDLPAGLEKVMLSSLARRPDHRPESAEAFREALAPYWDPELANPRILGGLMRSLRS